jgi:hypothetical protein
MSGTYSTDGSHEKLFQNNGHRTLREEANREMFIKEFGYKTVKWT